MCLRITFISIPTFRYATSNDEVTVGRNKCYKCCRSTAPYRAAVSYNDVVTMMNVGLSCLNLNQHYIKLLCLLVLNN